MLAYIIGQHVCLSELPILYHLLRLNCDGIKSAIIISSHSQEPSTTINPSPSARNYNHNA